MVGWFMVLNATFNNISVISWRSVLLVEETGVPGENDRPVASHWQTLSHNVTSSTLRHELDSNSHNVLYMALIAIRTHKISGDRHLEIQLPYERYHDDSLNKYNNHTSVTMTTPSINLTAIRAWPWRLPQ